MRRLLALALLILLAPSAAWSATCTTYSTSNPFGTYSGAVIDISGTLTVICTAGAPYQVAINAGMASGATVSSRAMSYSSTLLPYALFTDAARTTNWGNSAATHWVTGTGTGAAQKLTIYARLAAGVTVPKGSYTDTITATVTGGTAAVSAQFSVTATVAATCSITANPLSFGTYSGTALASTTTLGVTCTKGTAYNIGLGTGVATGATVTTRKMKSSAGGLISYGLFTSVAHTTNWGNTSGSWVAGTGSGVAKSTTIYGLIAAGQSANPGSYADTIIATVNY